MEYAMSIIIGILAFLGMQLVQFISKLGTASINKRESRRNLEVEKIETIILEIRDLVCESWASTGSDPKQDSIRNAVVGRITYVSMAIEELFQCDERKLHWLKKNTMSFLLHAQEMTFLTKIGEQMQQLVRILKCRHMY